MFKALLEVGLIILIILMVITQVLIPMFINDLELFWLFKSSKKYNSFPTSKEGQEGHTSLDDNLNELGTNAELQTNALKSTLSKVDKSIEKLNEVKRNVRI
jgi:hypothetical protein